MSKTFLTKEEQLKIFIFLELKINRQVVEATFTGRAKNHIKVSSRGFGYLRNTAFLSLIKRRVILGRRAQEKTYTSSRNSFLLIWK